MDTFVFVLLICSVKRYLETSIKNMQSAHVVLKYNSRHAIQQCMFETCKSKHVLLIAVTQVPSNVVMPQGSFFNAYIWIYSFLMYFKEVIR